jgi:hypothetical protein
MTRLIGDRDRIVGADKRHGSLPSMDAHPVDKACGRYGAGTRACTVSAAASANGARVHGSQGAGSGWNGVGS